MTRKLAGQIIIPTSTIPTSTSASGVWPLDNHTTALRAGKWPGQMLYTFTDATIYPNIAGSAGPTLAQVVAGTTSTGDVTWKNNTSYYNVTSGIISWTVAATATYRIEVWGARGGDATGNQYWGGYGARMRGDFVLAAGDIIKILVGQSGGTSYGGGGGGTFVATNANVPLIVAGGGNSLSAWSSVAVNAGVTTSSVAGDGTVAVTSNGYGGNSGANSTSGGGGFYGNGVVSTCASATIGYGFVNGGVGGNTCNSIGGFGGGTGSDGCCMGASGAGGGYTGGPGSTTSSGYGGAGGSYNSGTNQSNDAGGTGTATLAGNGKVIITKL